MMAIGYQSILAGSVTVMGLASPNPKPQNRLGTSTDLRRSHLLPFAPR